MMCCPVQAHLIFNQGIELIAQDNRAFERVMGNLQPFMLVVKQIKVIRSVTGYFDVNLFESVGFVIHFLG
jgi:hypothetical protein